jgi:protein-tyrosine phosphatase
MTGPSYEIQPLEQDNEVFDPTDPENFAMRNIFDVMKVLMVCLGNICRSPMAEGILSRLAAEHDLGWVVDSAGTGSWHIGEQPDARAIATCQTNGLDIRSQRARKIRRSDLDEFDVILTMDDANYRDVLRMAQSSDQREKIRMITAYAQSQYSSVPDPYFDGRFQEVFELLEELCDGIVNAHRS